LQAENAANLSDLADARSATVEVQQGEDALVAAIAAQKEALVAAIVAQKVINS
jgi:hypothetical protein